MKKLDSFSFSRRRLLLAGAATLTGCGGGSNLSGLLPGTGGTGIGVQGTISGFGSVIVKGTKYDDRTASIFLDGTASASSNLRIGMVANISGSLDSGTSTGTANRIDIWSIASGPLRFVDVVGASFQMVGMQFTTDSSTAFEGITSLSAITTDIAVTVWGLQTSSDGRNWLATRIKAIGATSTAIVTTGLLNPVAGTLNGYALTGASLSGYSDGQLVRAEGLLDNGTGVLTARTLTALGAEKLLSLSGKVELEGAVTRVIDSNHFALGTVTVDTTGIAGSSAISAINVGTLVEVSGVMQQGGLKASEMTIQGASEVMQIDITGTVELFNDISDFTVRGQRCDASSAAVQTGMISNMHLGSKVHVSGPTTGDEVLKVQYISVDVP